MSSVAPGLRSWGARGKGRQRSGTSLGPGCLHCEFTKITNDNQNQKCLFTWLELIQIGVITMLSSCWAGAQKSRGGGVVRERERERFLKSEKEEIKSEKMITSK